MKTREQQNASLIIGYSGVRPKLTEKEKLWFDKAIKLIEELGEADPESSDKLLALDAALVIGLAAAGLNQLELRLVVHEIAMTSAKLAMLVHMQKGRPNAGSNSN